MKREINIDQKSIEKLDNIDATKVANKVGNITVLRPFVSARNPHKCELTIIPMYPIAISAPLCVLFKFSSHCAMGSTKPMVDVSNRTAAKTIPDTKITK